MKSILIYIFLLLFFFGFGQDDGLILGGKKGTEIIRFSFIKNQIILPVKLNGNELNFLLDSGLKETLLLGKYEDTFNTTNLRKVNLRGLGKNDNGTTGYYSTKNIIQIGENYHSTNFNLVIIQDQDFNLFNRFGVEVHGIIGYDFFKNHPIQINYFTKKITVYKNSPKINKKYQQKEIEINQEYKPFIHLDIFNGQSYQNIKVLIDLGNSDGLWLLTDKFERFPSIQHAFLDELGKGLNGNVTGEKGTIEQVKLGTYEFLNPLISIPDSISTKFLNTENNRKGSIGNELLRRFTIILDYPNSKFYFKPNKWLNEPFHFNRSGLTIIHEYFEWMKKEMNLNVISQNSNNNENTQSVSYRYELKSVYSIESIRKNSNADKVGLLPNDKIISLNNRKVDKMSLDDIEHFMKDHEFEEITMEVERKKTIYTFKFVLDIPYDN